MGEISTPVIAFSDSNQVILNIIIAAIIFGIALELKLKDFHYVVKNIKGVSCGLVCQFILLPALTALLVYFSNIPAYMGLALILIASCPGGGFSNLLTRLCGGNSALSISMTAISSVFATFMTAANFTFWSSLNPKLLPILQSIDVNATELLSNVALILLLPLVLGMVVCNTTTYAHKLSSIVRKLSVSILVLFVTIGIVKNFDTLVNFLDSAVMWSVIHNTLALVLGYSAATLVNASPEDRKCITLEVGIQNAGFGIAIIFAYFGGQIEMLAMASIWGIWHLISGSVMSTLWKKGWIK